jgi:hypothetical protein
VVLSVLSQKLRPCHGLLMSRLFLNDHPCMFFLAITLRVCSFTYTKKLLYAVQYDSGVLQLPDFDCIFGLEIFQSHTHMAILLDLFEELNLPIENLEFLASNHPQFRLIH